MVNSAGESGDGARWWWCVVLHSGRESGDGEWWWRWCMVVVSVLVVYGTGEIGDGVR